MHLASEICVVLPRARLTAPATRSRCSPSARVALNLPPRSATSRSDEIATDRAAPTIASVVTGLELRQSLRRLPKLATSVPATSHGGRRLARS